MATPICPFCLTHHSFGVPPRCQKSDRDIPQLFIDNYGNQPPIWLMTVGFKQHGKTIYLGSLSMHIKNMSYLWPKAVQGTLDPYTQKFLQDAENYLSLNEGKKPDRTAVGIPYPILIQTNNIPEFGSHWIVLYDVAGELFESLELSPEMANIQSLNAVKNIWFFVDLDEMMSRPRPGKDINNLLDAYINSMSKLGWSLKGRNLIVVYTKGDLLLEDGLEQDQPNKPYLTKAISDYYWTDPLMDLIKCTQERSARMKFKEISQDFKMMDYLAKMKEQSDRLRQYTSDEVRGGRDLINRVENEQMGLEFCLISASGTKFDKQNGQPLNEIKPHRVFDPFLFALHLNQNIQHKKIKLVLDPSMSLEQFRGLNLNLLYERLQSVEHEIYTYYLGSARPALVTSQRPPQTTPNRLFSHHRIGPILDDGDHQAKVLLITQRSVDDLEDFNSEYWYNQMLYVSVSEANTQKWDNKILFHTEDDIHLIISEFKKMM